jgi:colanic acid biosynthesis glycosyl transferase WcaI
MTGSDVLIVTAWYPPEPAPFGQMMQELACALAAQGRRVTVVTSCPNHPQGVLHPGYRRRLLTRERRGDVEILRVLTFARPPGSPTRPRSIMERAAALVTFTVASALAVRLQTRPRVIFGVLQPLTVGLTLPLVARLKRARLVFNVQDLHPDAMIDLGLIRSPMLRRMLRAIERRAYRRADLLTVICEGFREHCVRRGATPGRTEVIPNWLDLDEVRPLAGAQRLREELGIPGDAFVVMYAGTIGLVSGAEVVIEAARLLAGIPDVHFAFVGDGPLVPRLRARVHSEGLANVSFSPFQPRERLAEVQSLADVSLVTLRSEHGRTSVPSKVLGYMAAGRPVIASVDSDSETARLVREAGCGEVVPPQDAARLAEAISSLRNDAVRRRECGRQGRLHLEQNYAKDVALQRYLAVFDRVLSGEAA